MDKCDTALILTLFLEGFGEVRLLATSTSPTFVVPTGKKVFFIENSENMGA
jgi:hypothetical protein